MWRVGTNPLFQMLRMLIPSQEIDRQQLVHIEVAYPRHLSRRGLVSVARRITSHADELAIHGYRSRTHRASTVRATRRGNFMCSVTSAVKKNPSEITASWRIVRSASTQDLCIANTDPDSPE